MVMSRDQNSGRNHNIKIDNISSEKLEEFRYLGTALTNQNSTQDEIKRKLKSGNVCYHSVHNLLLSNFLCENLKIQIYRTIILPVVWYGCETWSFTLGEELRLRVFENRVLRRIFGPKRGEVTGEGRKLHKVELNDVSSSANIFRVIKLRIMRWVGCVARMGERRGVYRVLVVKSEGNRPHGKPRRRWGIILRCIFRKWYVTAWTGSIWLRIGTVGGHL
jgi:hypothetical protein